MTRARTPDAQQFKEKIFVNPDEVVRGLEPIRALVKPVDELKREGNPYKDAERSKLAFQIKDALRDIFGEDSIEYQQNRNFRIKSTTKAEVTHALEFLQSLIEYLEDKKLALEGKKPGPAAPPPVAPAPSVAAPPYDCAKGRRPFSPFSDSGRAGQLRHRQIRRRESASQDRQPVPRGCPSVAPAARRPAHAGGRGRVQRAGRGSRAPLSGIRRDPQRDLAARLLRRRRAHLFCHPHDRIIIEVKKTRHGIGAKEIAGQLEQDTLFYWAHPDCQTLFCFVYDPEARVGDPYGLEKALTREVDGQRIEVFISPK